MAESMLVRIKPYNPKRGYLRRTHIEQRFGMRFKIGGWYEVPAHVARELRKVLQNPDDPESPEVFDVVTRAQAQEIRMHEELRIEQRAATPDAPTKLTVRAPKGQRGPNDEDETTDLAEEVPTVAKRRQPEASKAGRIAAELARKAAGEDSGDSGEEGPPYGADEFDPFDDDLSDAAAPVDPPTVDFDAAPRGRRTPLAADGEKRSGRGRGRKGSDKE